MPRCITIPTYRLHKQSGQAIVTLPDGLAAVVTFSWANMARQPAGVCPSHRRMVGQRAALACRKRGIFRARPQRQRVDPNLLGACGKLLPSSGRHAHERSGRHPPCLAPSTETMRTHSGSIFRHAGPGSAPAADGRDRPVAMVDGDAPRRSHDHARYRPGHDGQGLAVSAWQRSRHPRAAQDGASRPEPHYPHWAEGAGGLARVVASEPDGIPLSAARGPRAIRRGEKGQAQEQDPTVASRPQTKDQAEADAR